MAGVDSEGRWRPELHRVISTAMPSWRRGEERLGGEEFGHRRNA